MRRTRRDSLVVLRNQFCKNTGCLVSDPTFGIGGIDGNYRVITLIFKKYGNLPLCLENYALFLLPPIFTTILYTYIFRYMINLGEPSGNILSNYHGTFLHIFMHGYYPIYQKKIPKPSFFIIHARKSVSYADNFSIHLQNFLTLVQNK